MPEAVAGLLSAPRGKIKLITFKKSSKRRLYTKRFCCSAQNVGADMSVNRIMWLLREPDGVEHLCDSHLHLVSFSFLHQLSPSLCFRPSLCVHRGLRQQLVRRPLGRRAPLPGQRQPSAHQRHLDRVRIPLRPSVQSFGLPLR